MRFLALPLLLAACVPLLAKEDATAPASSWLHWRGPTMQGHVSDTRVPLEWSETKNVLWTTPLPGDGHSSPIITGGRIFLTGAKDKGRERHVYCLDANTGKMLWQKTAAKDQPIEKTHGWHGYASPSCATDGKYVFAFFGTPGVFCYDIDGKLIWSQKFGVFTSELGWNTAASPFLYGDTLILNCDNDGGAGAAPASLVALDKATGKEVWATPRNQGRGFGTPMLLKTANGRVDLVLNGPFGVWGYDPKTGKELWRCVRNPSDEQNRFGEPMPVSDGQHLFAQSGRTGLYQVLRVPDTETGDVTKTNVVYQTARKKRDVASPIIVEGKVYCTDKGSQLTVFDLKSGKEKARLDLGRDKNSMASPLYVKGVLMWLLADGTTVLVEPGESPKVVGRNKLPGGSLDYGASPAVVDGRMYIRSRTKLYCIGEKR
jgi:outer membrane protein assembly factor BamB